MSETYDAIVIGAGIIGCEGGRDHDADPVRISLRHIGREIDAGFFSHRRKINAENSFSVLG